MRLSAVLCFLTLAAVPLPAQYFPPGVFDKTPQKDESTASEGKFLKALHEPSLWELSRQKPEAEVTDSSGCGRFITLLLSGWWCAA
jgi:hypothetical protein